MQNSGPTSQSKSGFLGVLSHFWQLITGASTPNGGRKRRVGSLYAGDYYDYKKAPASLPKRLAVEPVSSRNEQPVQEQLPDVLNNPFKKGLFPYLSNKDLVNLSESSRQLYSWTSLEMEKRALTLPLMLAVVRGNEAEAKRLLTLTPSLLRSKNTDIIDFSGRLIKQLTPFQAALTAGDAEMCEMMKPYFALPENGQVELERQYHEIFPHGIDAYVEQQKNEAFDFSSIFNVIKNASDDDIQAALNKEFEKDTSLNRALNAFREQFHCKSLSEKIYNPQHLVCAFQKYVAEFNNIATEEKRNLLWRQVIGFVQRYLPACYAQAFANGVYSINEYKYPLVRSFEFKEFWQETIFPLSPLSGLGFDWSVPSNSWRAERATSCHPFMYLSSFTLYSCYNYYVEQKNIRLARITHAVTAAPAPTLGHNSLDISRSANGACKRALSSIYDYVTKALDRTPKAQAIELASSRDEQPIQKQLPYLLNNPFKKRVFPYLSDKDLVNLSASCRQLYSWTSSEREQRAFTLPLMLAVVRGNEDEAKRLLAFNPSLLQNNDAVVTDYQGRKIEGLTSFQAALCAGDVEMCEMMKPYFAKFVDGHAELKRQYHEIFPNGFDTHVEQQKNEAFDFTHILNAIKIASDDEVQAVLNKHHDYDRAQAAINEICGNDEVEADLNKGFDIGTFLNNIFNFDGYAALYRRGLPLNRALNAFKEQFHCKSLSEKIYNPQHLLRAFQTYVHEFDNLETKERRAMFYRVICFVQHYLPVCYAQAFANELEDIVKYKSSLKRIFEFRKPIESLSYALGDHNRGWDSRTQTGGHDKNKGYQYVISYRDSRTERWELESYKWAKRVQDKGGGKAGTRQNAEYRLQILQEFCRLKALGLQELLTSARRRLSNVKP